MKTTKLINIALLLGVLALAGAGQRVGAAAPPDLSQAAKASGVFEGKYYRGCGDVEYLQLLEVAARFFEPDPELQNLAMLYEPEWNGLTTAPTLKGWHVHRSYGTTYAVLPFLREPFLTFLQNSQDLWFDQMGDGKRAGAPPPCNWTAPDGALGHWARPGAIFYKCTDGQAELNDWALEPTAAAVLLQAEALLISRDLQAVARYLPKLERCVSFVETRRNPENNLFQAGAAANLLAPSYAGFRRPDGVYDKAYLAGLSITYIAALDRLIELEKLAGRTNEAAGYANLRDSAKRALPALTVEEGYFVKSIDSDGAKHGVLNASRYGYFEAPPNHDAVAFRVVDEAQAEKIYCKIASLPGLRPHDFVLPNFPSYDDTYEKTEGQWAYGQWVNGGHWSSCEARMMLAYYRLSRFDDARRSMRALLDFASRWRMDNPLAKFGSAITHTNEPVNLCYDAFGPAAAFRRGLFEYRYSAEGLTLVPHVPPDIAQLDQLNSIRLGRKQIYLSTTGTGAVAAVRVNGKPWPLFDKVSVSLPYERTPDTAKVEITLGEGEAPVKFALTKGAGQGAEIKKQNLPTELAALDKRAARLRDFARRLAKAKLGGAYEFAHAQLTVDCIAMIHVRRQLQTTGQLAALPEPSQSAADKSFMETAAKLCDGLEGLMKNYLASSDPQRQQISRLWQASGR